MSVPESFRKLLFDTDPQLVVYFNQFKGCHMIDRRTENGETSNVLVCKADNGDALPLNENLIARLRSMDTWKQFGSYEAWHAHNLNVAAEDEAKRDAEIRESYRLASIDDKRQLGQAYDLIKRHDVARPNQ